MRRPARTTPYTEDWFNASSQKYQELDRQADGNYIDEYWNRNGFATEYDWYTASDQRYQQETFDYSGNPIVYVWNLGAGGWSEYANYYTPQDRLKTEVTWAIIALRSGVTIGNAY